MVFRIGLNLLNLIKSRSTLTMSGGHIKHRTGFNLDVARSGFSLLDIVSLEQVLI